MEMSEFDICKSYREAGCTRSQIKILADLNQCGEKDIARILDAGGETVDKRLLKSGRKQQQEVEAQEPEQSVEEVLPQKAPISAGVLFAILEKELSESENDPVMINGKKLRKIAATRVYDKDMNVRVRLRLLTDDNEPVLITIGGHDEQ